MDTAAQDMLKALPQPEAWDLGYIAFMVPGHHFDLPNPIIVRTEIRQFWDIFNLTQEIGSEGVIRLLGFVSGIEDDITDVLRQARGQERDTPVSVEARTAAYTICVGISRFAELELKPSKRRRDPRVERVSLFIYGLLTNFHIGYEQATHIANVLLEREMSTEAWRKYITRWAERNDLGKPDLRRREA